jgi:prepilin-type processing-associated H-X9-DG protein
VVGRNAAWPGEKTRKLRNAGFAGQASRTIMLVEVVAPSISWTEPRDYVLDDAGPGDATAAALNVSSYHGPDDDFFFTYDHHGGANVAMVDGGVKFLPPGALSNEHLRKILQVGGYREEENGPGGALFCEGRRLNWRNIAALAVWVLSVGTLLASAVRSRKVKPPSAAVNGSRWEGDISK